MHFLIGNLVTLVLYFNSNQSAQSLKFPQDLNLTSPLTSTPSPPLLLTNKSDINTKDKLFIDWVDYFEDPDLLRKVLLEDMDYPNFTDTPIFTQEPKNGTKLTMGLECYENFEDVADVIEDSRYWLEGIGLATLAIIGLLGNTLTVIVLAIFDRKSHFNTLLMTLVMIDNLLLATYIMDSAYLSALKYQEPRWYKWAYPYLWHPIKNIIKTACVYMVVAVAGERYQAICHPLKYKPGPSRYLILVLVLSVSLNAPKFMEFRHVQGYPDYDYFTTALNENSYYVVFNSYLQCVAVGILPLVAICILNYKIYAKIRKSSRLKYRHYGKGANSQYGYSVGVAMGDARANSFHRRASQKSTATTVVPAIEETAFNSNIKKVVEKTVSHKSQQTIVMQLRTPKKGNSINPNEADQIEVESEIGPNEDINPILTSADQKETEEKGASVSPDGFESKFRNTSSHSYTFGSNFRFRSQREKSTRILFLIVILFAFCHSFRVGHEIYVIASPTHGLLEHFDNCRKLGRLHVPVIMHILGNVNHLLMVLNSSVNFLIYCFMAKRFRKSLLKLTQTIKRRLFCVKNQEN